MDNYNKTVLITGISKGIGNGLALKFIELGYTVLGTVRKEQSINGVHKLYQLDLTNYQNITQTAKQLIEDDIKIDIIINNAGIGSDFDEKLSKAENFELRFQTHLFGTFFFTEAILSLLKPHGKIINISSKLASSNEIDKIDSSKLTLNKMAYIMSKSSLNSYTKLLANRLKSEHIEVLSIHPGWVKTKLSKTNKNAPMDIANSVDGIISLLNTPKPSGTFWDAEKQIQLDW